MSKVNEGMGFRDMMVSRKRVMKKPVGGKGRKKEPHLERTYVGMEVLSERENLSALPRVLPLTTNQTQ